jgi:Short C-terminal domain
MPRMLRRAAVLGATAHVASKHGQAKAAAQQEAAAPPQPAAVPEVPPAPEAPATHSPADSYDELMKLKGLLDAGVLTQAEFDAQKQRILSS